MAASSESPSEHGRAGFASFPPFYCKLVGFELSPRSSDHPTLCFRFRLMPIERDQLVILLQVPSFTESSLPPHPVSLPLFCRYPSPLSYRGSQPFFSFRVKKPYIGILPG